MVKSWSGALEPLPLSPGQWSRRAVARSLRWMSKQLSAWSRAWAEPAAPAALVAPVLEFYSEAGAPEGALFVDGERVGTLAGVTRL